MQKIAEELNFKAFLLEPGKQLDLRERRVIGEILPVECYIKPDADVNDKPGLIFVLHGFGGEVVFQISQRMLQPVLDQLAIMKG